MTEYDYDGWAPCIHGTEEGVVTLATQFIKDQTPDFSGKLKSPWLDVHGGILEDMIYQLTNLTSRGDIQFDCDQWWGVFVEGCIYVDKESKNFKTRVQADTLLLGVAETLRWWDEKYKELRPNE